MLRRTLIASAFALALPSFAAGKAPRRSLVIIGAGGAGLAAAVSAAEAGLRDILVLEKAYFAGGHTIISEGSLSALDSGMGERERELWITETLEAGAFMGRRIMVETLVDRSREILPWLAGMGVKWADGVFEAWSGRTARSHSTGSERPAADYVRALSSRAKSLGISIRFGVRAQEIIIDGSGRAAGVRIVDEAGTPEEIAASAVIIATGGFTANAAMRTNFDPRLDASLKTTANPTGRAFDGATGDGIVMAEKAGAVTGGMGYFEVIPLQGGRLLNYTGGDIFVNNEGKRFVDESREASEILGVYLALPDRVMWVITDSQSRKNSGFERKLLTGVVQRAETVAEMASMMAVPAENLEETLRRYNRFADEGLDRDFGKKIFTQRIDKPPYYFGRESFDVHSSLGGILTDERARVLGRNGAPIPGLYAAGEVTGGIHGRNRLGGNGIIVALVFGKIAGEDAARETAGSAPTRAGERGS